MADHAAARREAERANRTKDHFLAMLGHELRNPLAPMLTALELMKLRGQARDRERSLDAGFERHLVKPINLDELQRILEAPAARK